MHTPFKKSRFENILSSSLDFRKMILLMLSMCILLSVMTLEAQAGKNSYSIKWYASDPAINNDVYKPTYIKYTADYIDCPGTAGRYDGSTILPHAVLYDPESLATDAVTSLAPRNLALGEIVPFQVEITVNGDTTDENGIIQFTTEFNTYTTSGSNFGFDPQYKVYCAFVDTSEAVTIDTGNDAKVDSYTSTLQGSGSSESISTTFQISGLDNGDRIVVELWVFLKRNIPSDSSGNVPSKFVSAKTDANDTINTGAMNIPIINVASVNEFFTEINDISVIKTDNPDPVVQGQQLTYNLTLRNNGDSNVTNMILVTEKLSPWLSFVSTSVDSYTINGNDIIYNVGALSPGETKSVTVVTNVSLNAPTDNDTTMNPQTGGYSVPVLYDIYNNVTICGMCIDSNPSNNIYYQPTNVLPAPVYTCTLGQNCSQLTINSTPSYGLSLKIVWKDQNNTISHIELLQKIDGKYTSLFDPPNSGGTWTIEITEYSGSEGTGHIVGVGQDTIVCPGILPEFPVASSVFLIVTSVVYLGMRKKMAGILNGKK